VSAGAPFTRRIRVSGVAVLLSSVLRVSGFFWELMPAAWLLSRTRLGVASGVAPL
jgi:hypothetical protein